MTSTPSPFEDLTASARAVVEAYRSDPEPPPEVALLVKRLRRSIVSTDARAILTALRALLHETHSAARAPRAPWMTRRRFEASRRAAIAHDAALDAVAGIAP